MSTDRLLDIQSHLKKLYEQLAGQEDALIMAEDSQKTRIKQQTRSLKEFISKFESEYLNILSHRLNRYSLPESTAQILIAELADEIEILTPVEQHNETKNLLLEILDILQRPNTPASAKLKIAIPLVPNIVSYEIQGDTEKIVRKLFPTFIKIYEKLISNHSFGETKK